MKKEMLELWIRRSLIWDLAVTDLKLRYRNSILGFFWTFLEPLMMLTVLYLVFTYIIKSEIENFPLYLLLGIIIWNVMVRATTFSLNSIISKAGIISQIYIPKEIMAISSNITVMMMFGFELIAFMVFLAVFSFIPPITIIFLPIIVILLFVLVLGISLPLSVLNVYFRDIQFIWNVVVHAGFFLVPIIYTLDMIPEELRKIVILNPMVQLIEMAHNVTLYNILPKVEDLAYTTIVIIVIFISGYLIFKRFESKVVEEL